MRSFFSSLFILSFFFSFGQVPASYFQQEVNTTIDVNLDDVKHQLGGTIEIEYINNSPDTLEEIFIHLWGNAFKERETAFDKQQLRIGSNDFHFSKEEDKGYYSDLAFKIDGLSVDYSNHEDHIDIAKLILPEKLLPGDRIIINTPLHLKIPKSFSRLGHVGTSYQMTQWFPKPAVYDQKGWHPMPYYNMGEFYSEFGSYDVSITLPKNYYVGATGVLETNSEIQFINERIVQTAQLLQDTTYTNMNSFPLSDTEVKTLRYTAENVHDFAWFADKRFYIEKGLVELANNTVETFVFYTDTERKLWRDALSYVNRSVEYYSEKVGEYPYPHATAVQSALSAGGGMEYPMITVIGLSNDAKALDEVITHEVGHNWFYGILAFNERDYPWMDEGINSYYDHRYSQKYYNESKDGIPKFIANNLEMSTMRLVLYLQMRRGQDQAPHTHSNYFDMLNYGLSAYEKAAIAFEHLSYYLGVAQYDQIMQDFYETWKFKHPQPHDLKAHFDARTDKNLEWFWDGLIGSNKEVNYAISRVQESDKELRVTVKNKGEIATPYPITIFDKNKKEQTIWKEGHQGTKTYSISHDDYNEMMIDTGFTSLDINYNNNYKKKGIQWPSIGFLSSLDNSKKKQLFIIPTFGVNRYDGMMLGLGLHNLALPMPRLKASIITMYGFKSKRPVGNAYLEYQHILKGSKIHSIKYSLFSKQFSLRNTNYSTDEELYKNVRYGIIAPKIEIDFATPYHVRTENKIILKSTLVQHVYEFLNDSGDKKYDSAFTELKYKYSTRNNRIWEYGFYLRAEHQMYELYFPESEKGQSIKIDAAVNLKYQYIKNRFITVRLYGAAMPYHSNEKLSYSNPGLLSLVANGHTDYKMEDYYFGRNELDGFYASQIHYNQGGMSLPQMGPYQYLYQSNYLAGTVNLAMNLPFQNKIGKYTYLYADVGHLTDINYNLEGDPKSTTLLYQAGVRFKFFNVLSINIPLIHSNNLDVVYPKFHHRISFSLDLRKMDPIKLYQKFTIN